MDTFIFCGNFERSRFDKPTEVNSCIHSNKPRHGGLWVSPLQDSGKTAWEEWCESEDYQHSSLGCKRYVVTPKKHAKIYTAESDESLPLHVDHDLPWHVILAEYDALLIPEDYHWLRWDGYDVASLWIINLDAFNIKPLRKEV